MADPGGAIGNPVCPACGRGPCRYLFTKATMERKFQVQALESSPANRELCAVMNGFEPDPIMLDKAFADRNQQAWDIVLLSQMLEHIVDLEEMVGFIAGMLKDGAIAAIAVPHCGSLISMIQRRNDMFIIPPEHWNLFAISGLRQLFKHHDFRLLHVETVSRFNRNKLLRRLRMGVFDDTLGAAPAAILRITDSLRMGMYINAYFRKETTG